MLHLIKELYLKCRLVFFFLTFTMFSESVVIALKPMLITNFSCLRNDLLSKYNISRNIYKQNLSTYCKYIINIGKPPIMNSLPYHSISTLYYTTVLLLLERRTTYNIFVTSSKTYSKCNRVVSVNP